MSSYCKSCYRDLPSENVPCRHCLTAAASTTSPGLGLLLMALVVAGMLTLDVRLTILGAVLALVLIAAQIMRVLRAKS